MDPSRTPTRLEELLAQADWARGLARSLCRDDADADDIVQDAYVAALRQPPDLVAAPRAWFAGVVRNLSRMRWRSGARRERREAVAAEGAQPPEDPAAIVARMETQRLLADAVLALEEPWRSTVVLRYIDGLSSAEIARRQDITASTVRGRLRDGLDKLRVELDRRHDGRRNVWLTALVPFLALPAAGVTAAAASATLATPAKLAVAGLGVIGLVAVGFFAFGSPFSGGASGESGATPPLPPAPPPHVQPQEEAGPGASEIPEPEVEPSEPTPVPQPPDPGISEPAAPPAPLPAAHPEPAPPTEADAPPEPPAAPLPVPPTPIDLPVRPPVSVAVVIPAGMVRVPPGRALIGTTWTRLEELLEGRPPLIRRVFAYEAPRHAVDMGAYCIDRFEVTNAQYLRFLEDTAKTSYDTDQANLANLEEVAGSLIGLPKDRWSKDDVAWQQLYRSNRDTLWKGMPDRIVRDEQGKVDEAKTEQAFHHAALTRSMVLEFWKRKPPETWPSAVPSEPMLDLPVLSVSYEDAAAFAEWAGKHIPTENEWEYAARGPEGRLWPWGNTWDEDGSRANWGGKHKDAHHEPVPLPVESLPEGQSWCGALHLLGNAAEWTSSWFGPYPGSDREHRFMGEYVKVIRGATYVDESPLALRVAARNFIGAGSVAPPRPGNRFDYVGFRCAWYREPGRDRLEPIVGRLARARRLKRADLDLDRWAGASATHYAAPGAHVEHHVFVRGKAHAIVVVPLSSLGTPNREPIRIKTRKSLLKESAAPDAPFLLGVLHTDVPLARVHVPTREPPSRRGGRRKGRRNGVPPTKEGRCAPGTYVIALQHGRIALLLPSLDLACYLTKREVLRGELDLVRLETGSRPGTTLEVEPDADLVFLGLSLPVGGPRPDPRSTLVLKTIELNPAPGALRAAGAWTTGDS